MTILTQNSIEEAINLAVILTEACSRSGTAGMAVKNMQEALTIEHKDPRVLKLAELFTSEMVGDKSPALTKEISDLVQQLGATPVTLEH